MDVVQRYFRYKNIFNILHLDSPEYTNFLNFLNNKIREILSRNYNFRVKRIEQKSSLNLAKVFSVKGNYLLKSYSYRNFFVPIIEKAITCLQPTNFHLLTAVHTKDRKLGLMIENDPPSLIIVLYPYLEHCSHPHITLENDALSIIKSLAEFHSKTHFLIYKWIKKWTTHKQKFLHPLMLPNYNIFNLPSKFLTLLHGDFCIQNLLVNGRDLFLVDLEQLGIGPPEYDLAWFALSISREKHASLIRMYNQYSSFKIDRKIFSKYLTYFLTYLYHKARLDKIFQKT